MDKIKPFNEFIFYAVLLFIIFLILFFVSLYKDSKEINPIILKETPKETVKLTDKSDYFVFNAGSKKFHKPSCRWAKKCTRCIKIKKEEALKREGIPCKSCF